jgi:hypothetical protein
MSVAAGLSNAQLQRGSTVLSTGTEDGTRNGIFGKVAVYFLIPIGCSAILVAMYFSGNDTLQSVVAPHSFNKMRPDSGREFGLLENI